MSLLDNAIRSIQIGLDDYRCDERLVSSVRNIYAGILLLFKYKLFLLSGKETNAALIKQSVVPAIDSQGAVIWKGVGNKTIDVAGIKSRFKSLEIDVDWATFDRISKHRNEVEHFFSQLSEDKISELLADCFMIISRFLSHNLNLDAREVLGDEAWQILLDAYEVYDYEIERNSTVIGSLTFYHDVIKKVFLEFTCISCSSPLVQPNRSGAAEDVTFFCAECESEYSYDDICNMGVSDLYINSFQAGLEEVDRPFCNCEICSQGLYLKEYRVCTSCGSID